MIRCISCNFQNGNGNKFCEACGTALPDGQNRLPKTVLVSAPSAPTTTVQLKLEDGKLFSLHSVHGEGEFGVGRADPASRWYPVVDLTTHGAEPAGVSRHHARILIEQDGVFVIDTGSSNGTQRNDEKLLPNQRYLLRNGDRVLFGRLLARIVIRTT